MARRPTDGEWATLRSWFPNLPRDSVWVLGGATTRYNCLAWALGRTDRWIWPWSGLPTLAQFTAYLRNFGYATGTPAAAAAYGKAAGSTYAIGHIARFWVGAPSSKLGSYLLIHHTWGGLNGGTYGSLRQYYRRVSLLQERAEPMEDIEVQVEEGEPLPELSDDEMSYLRSLADSVEADAKARFEDAYGRWKAALLEPPVLLDSTGVSATMVQSFHETVVAAQDAVPLLLLRLLEPDEHFALRIAEQILPPGAVALFELDDPQTTEGEQYRARLTVLSWLSMQ